MRFQRVEKSIHRSLKQRPLALGTRAAIEEEKNAVWSVDRIKSGHLLRLAVFVDAECVPWQVGYCFFCGIGHRHIHENAVGIQLYGKRNVLRREQSRPEKDADGRQHSDSWIHNDYISPQTDDSRTFNLVLPS